MCVNRGPSENSTFHTTTKIIRIRNLQNLLRLDEEVANSHYDQGTIIILPIYTTTTSNLVTDYSLDK